MAASLPFEFSKFNKNCRYLRRILKQTQGTLEEIKTTGKFYEEQLATVNFTSEELHKIKQVVECAPRVIVLGQNSYAKACVVNWLLGQAILPLGSSEHSDKVSWRTVCFQFGICNEISLSLPDSYELVQHLQAYDRPWNTVPPADLELKDDACKDNAQACAVLEIRLRHALLKDDAQIIVSPTNFVTNIEQFVKQYSLNAIPFLVYAMSEDSLSPKDIEELTVLRTHVPHLPVFFAKMPPLPSEELTESEQHVQFEYLRDRQRTIACSMSPTELHQYPTSALKIFQQLCSIGYLTMIPCRKPSHTRTCRDPSKLESEFVESFENMNAFVLFARHVLQSHIVAVASVLNEGHTRCLRMFILSAFDMNRDILITPKRLEYAREKETELFSSLMDIADHKQDEIKDLILDTIANMKEELLEKASTYEFKGVYVAQVGGEITSTRELKICTGEIQDLILGSLNNAVAKKLIDSVDYLRESFVGTLQRCLKSLENACKDDGDSPQASAALTQILNAAYHVEVTTKTSSSFMRVLWEKMKQLIQSMPWKTPPRIDGEWKKKIALDMIHSLSESRLARSICWQFRDKLKQSHEVFATALKHLEARHNGRLEKTEEQRIKVRKLLTPQIARYALECTSLRDVLMYGMPQLGREIGRGQYGVVYSCESWAGHSPCSLKSVVPPDEKHWNDLAMEFYYTRSLPDHERLVAIRGSVIDHSYGGGSSPAVLLIMDRLQKDLYTAIKTGMDWVSRLQVALDVVQGIRFLHSQGLIHRDIKLKNVLLDKRNRAKITDLGFCKPEAMMSGSIVGTPIHMAPELFTGRYDSTVDVYAFGILFWYTCAGQVRLPYVYEQCQNKDQLWTAVKKGARPERLPQFDDECWCLMEECWAGEPIQRPLLGNVEHRLMAIKERYRHQPPPGTEFQQRELGLLSTSPYIDVDFSPS